MGALQSQERSTARSSSFSRSITPGSQLVVKPSKIRALKEKNNLVFSHRGMKGESMEALEQSFASDINSESLEPLARLLVSGLQASKRDHRRSLYYRLRVLVQSFTSSRALSNLERLLKEGASSFPQQPILVQLIQRLGNAPATNPIQTDVLPPSTFPEDRRTEDTSELSVTGDASYSAKQIEEYITKDYSVLLGSGLQAKIRALPNVDNISSSFEKWFDNLLGIRKESTSADFSRMSPQSVQEISSAENTSRWEDTSVSCMRLPSSCSDDAFQKNDCNTGILRRHAAAMVYWALDEYREPSTPEEAQLRCLLLFAAGTLLQRCSEDAKRDYVLASLADILVADLELLHSNLHFLENTQLMEEVGRRIIPFAYVKNNDAFPEEQAHMFLLFMQLVCLENDILLDEEDLYLLSKLKDANRFPFWDYEEQLRTHGVCVQLRKKEGDSPVDSALSFRYGENGFLLHVQPTRLSALGFSILSFILVPSDKTQKAFLALVGLTKSFTNCFIKHFKKDGKRVLEDEMQKENLRAVIGKLLEEKAEEVHYSKVCIPLGWTLKLDLSKDFLIRHGTVGSIGVLLGNESTAITPIKPPPRNAPEEHRISPVSLVEPVGNIFRSKSLSQSGHIPNENVFIDNEYRLVYKQPAKRPFKLTSLNFGAGLSCFSASAGMESTNQREPIKTYFITLAQFVTFMFRHSRKAGLVTRLTWLETALVHRNVFLDGENQSLLENVFCEDVCRLDRREILERDCRMKHRQLHKQNYPLPFKVQSLRRGEEGADSNTVFFVDQLTGGKDAENVYKASFEVVPSKNDKGEVLKDQNGNMLVDGICLTGRCERATGADQNDLNKAQILDIDLV